MEALFQMQYNKEVEGIKTVFLWVSFFIQPLEDYKNSNSKNSNVVSESRWIYHTEALEQIPSVVEEHLGQRKPPLSPLRVHWEKTMRHWPYPFSGRAAKLGGQGTPVTRLDF